MVIEVDAKRTLRRGRMFFLVMLVVSLSGVWYSAATSDWVPLVAGSVNGVIWTMRAWRYTLSIRDLTMRDLPK